jgi:hypothetical protein
MRQLLFVAIMVAFSSIGFSSNPPEAVNKAFKLKFPSATNIKWGKEGEKGWEANFKLENINMSANYLDSGAWLETETEISVSKIPDAVIDAINKSDKDYKILGGAIIERINAETIYEVDIKAGLIKKEVFYKPDGSTTK